MNNNLNLLLFIILILFSVTSSCDENSNPNQNINDTDYFPMTIGNYWVFNSYELNINHQKVDGTETRDSIVYSDVLTIEGRTAHLLVVYRNEQLYDSIYISKESKKILMLFDDNEIDVPGIEKQWFLIADFTKSKNTEWHIYDSIMTDYPIIFEDSLINTTYHHTINGKYENDDNISVNNALIKYKIIQVKYDTRLYFIYKFPDNISTEEVVVNKIRQKYLYFYFAENIGLVGMKYNPYTIITRTDPITGYYKTESNNGRKSDLIDFRIIHPESD